jgi:ankyrin repeat protein
MKQDFLDMYNKDDGIEDSENSGGFYGYSALEILGVMWIIQTFYNLASMVWKSQFSLDSQLKFASYFNWTSYAMELLDEGANPNSNLFFDSPLMLAARHGNLALTESLLDRGADVQYCNIKGSTALIVAASKNHAEAARLLLDRGADVQYSTPKGTTALIIAAYENHIDVARLLLDSGADVEYSNPKGLTALIAAASKNHTEAALLLLDHGANPNNSNLVFDSPFFDAPLMFAALNGNLALTKSLLDRGSDVEYSNPNGINALIVAASKNHTEAALLLLDRGANIDPICPENGFTPLMYSCYLKNSDLASRLLKDGADVNIESTQHITSLWWAIRCGDLEIIRLLVEHGATIDRTTTEISPLDKATAMGSISVTSILLGVEENVLNDLVQASGNSLQDLAREVEAYEAGEVVITPELEEMSRLKKVACLNSDIRRADLGFKRAISDQDFRTEYLKDIRATKEKLDDSEYESDCTGQESFAKIHSKVYDQSSVPRLEFQALCSLMNNDARDKLIELLPPTLLRKFDLLCELKAPTEATIEELPELLGADAEAT